MPSNVAQGETLPRPQEAHMMRRLTGRDVYERGPQAWRQHPAVGLHAPRPYLLYRQGGQQCLDLVQVWGVKPRRERAIDFL